MGTGQYSNVSDFGLYFYNARWMDPQLGRFTSADSIVPGGVQGYDRYAYVNNSPVNYVDPSGHKECDYKCQIEYENADPAYEHYGEGLEWNIAKQQKNKEFAEATLYGGAELALWTFAPPVGLFFQTINGEPVSGWDVAFAAIPLGEASGAGDVIVQQIGKYGDDVVKATGQWHHLFSTKIMRALDEHEILSGVFKRNDSLAQAVDSASHRGYQTWHRVYDAGVVRWLENEGSAASPRQFLEYLRDVHLSPDLQNRFPNAVELITNAIEAIR